MAEVDMFQGLDGEEAEQLKLALAASMQDSKVSSKSPAHVKKAAIKSEPAKVYRIPSSSPEPEVKVTVTRMTLAEQMRETAMHRKRKADALRDAEDKAEKQVASFHGFPSPPVASTSSAGPSAKRFRGNDDLAGRRTDVTFDTMRFPNGALRLTRTPGRGERNTTTFEELVNPHKMLSGVFYAFFIAQDELFDRLQPFKVPTYVGRDASQDLAQGEYTEAEGIELGDLKKAKKEVFDAYVEWATKYYPRQFGANFKAFYARKISGCAHSKIMLVEYPKFARIIIGTSNFMNCDFMHSDNTWFIQDFPRVTKKVKEPSQISHFFDHFLELNCPKEGVAPFQKGNFDYSALKIQICLSRPGVSKRLDDNFAFGALRLLLVCKKLLKKVVDLPDVLLEINTASLGQLTPAFLHEMHQNITGGKQDSSTDEEVPNVKLIFPTRADVEGSTFGKAPACNMGSHIKWADAPRCVKDMLYHYDSIDPGMMFHNKLLLALDADNPDECPLLIYIGSANFSRAAWGEVGADVDKTEKCSNYEAGVIVPGDLLESMLEKGSVWTDIVPYKRPGRKYKLSDKTEKPWNSETWVTARRA